MIELAALVRREAAELGFDAVGIATPDGIGAAGARLEACIDAGHHGDMTWLADTVDRRRHPSALWPEARSVVMLGLSYAPDTDPLDALAQSDRATISAYAKGRDYHEVIKGRLKTLAGKLASASGAEVKVFVDTAPLMEKPLAQAAGLGWQGKHTNLVSRAHGSWLFLGAILTTAEIKADAAETDHCGSCRRCLDICPTAAFPAPYVLDARRCIAYLTIEHKGPIPRELRQAIGNRVFGCDDCLAVCPWNKFAATAREMRFAARSETDNPPLADVLTLDDQTFRRRFAGTPIKRTGRNRLVRNALIAAGNSGEVTLAAQAERLLADASPLVRGMAIWALSQLLCRDDVRRLRAAHDAEELDADVRAEWHATDHPDTPAAGAADQPTAECP